MSTLGCSRNQLAVQTEIVYRSIPDSLLTPCVVVEPNVTEESFSSYEEAFYVVSEAYLSTNRSVSLCNINILEAIKYNDRIKEHSNK